MSAPPPRAHEVERQSFTRRYLDPADRLNEILFGLIMVLTFTLTAGLTVADGPDAGRELLLATIGCNVAWGVIDGAMYLMGQLLERSRAERALRALRAAPDDAARLAVVAERIEDVLGDSLVAHASEEERTRLIRLVRDVALRAPERRTRLRREDVLGAVASGWLVIATTLPAALPFLFIDQPWRALRVSNLLLVVLLFAVGSEWGRASYINRWLCGLAFLAIGLALVATAIALGG
jgi:hypothetical protein